MHTFSHSKVVIVLIQLEEDLVVEEEEVLEELVEIEVSVVIEVVV